LKFENIVIGFNNPEKIYLIDFGLAISFVDAKNNHVKKIYLQKFSGNFMFASLNSCRGFNKSRRDDIESLFYLLIFMLNQGYLPWVDLET
jgi:casein kinase 1